MTGLKVEDIKQFTSNLFIGTIFDYFLIREAEIFTYNTFHIDGKVRAGYYTEQEIETKKIEEFSTWETVKPVCFSLIKGKKLPESFRIVLQLGKEQIAQFLQEKQLGIQAEQIGGMYLNIRYETGELYCVTGTSLNFFTMDKSLEIEWDETVKLFFKEHHIPYILGI